MNDELRVRPGFAGQSVLIISPFDEDHVRLGRVLGDCGCQAHAVRSCRQGLAVLRQQFASVVILNVTFRMALGRTYCKLWTCYATVLH